MSKLASFWTVRFLIPKRYACNIRLKKKHARGGREIVRGTGPELLLLDTAPLNKTGKISMESQCYSCLTTPLVDMPIWTGEIPYDPTPGERATGAQYLLSWLDA